MFYCENLTVIITWRVLTHMNLEKLADEASTALQEIMAKVVFSFFLSLGSVDSQTRFDGKHQPHHPWHWPHTFCLENPHGNLKRSWVPPSQPLPRSLGVTHMVQVPNTCDWHSRLIERSSWRMGIEVCVFFWLFFSFLIFYSVCKAPRMSRSQVLSPEWLTADGVLTDVQYAPGRACVGSRGIAIGLWWWSSCLCREWKTQKCNILVGDKGILLVECPKCAWRADRLDVLGVTTWWRIAMIISASLLHLFNVISLITWWFDEMELQDQRIVALSPRAKCQFVSHKTLAPDVVRHDFSAAKSISWVRAMVCRDTCVLGWCCLGSLQSVYGYRIPKETQWFWTQNKALEPLRKSPRWEKSSKRLLLNTGWLCNFPRFFLLKVCGTMHKRKSVPEKSQWMMHVWPLTETRTRRSGFYQHKGWEER